MDNSNFSNIGLGLDILSKAVAEVSRQQAKADAYSPGVCWSGLTEDPPKVETVEAVAQRLQRQHEANQAFRNSPRGRLFFAIVELEEFGVWEEANKLRGIYDRSLGEEEPWDDQVRAIGACLAILAGLNLPTARDAERALAEWLMGSALKRAA